MCASSTSFFTSLSKYKTSLPHVIFTVSVSLRVPPRPHPFYFLLFFLSETLGHFDLITVDNIFRGHSRATVWTSFNIPEVCPGHTKSISARNREKHGRVTLTDPFVILNLK